VIPPYVPNAPGKTEISILPADDLIAKFAFENTLTNEKGDQAKLKPGADVEVTVEADINAPEPKETSKTSIPEKTTDKKRQSQLPFRGYSRLPAKDQGLGQSPRALYSYV